MIEKQALDDPFLGTMPVFAEFEGVADAANYRPLPDDWALAAADIVSSTKAIDAGRYKAVNMAGAAVISAVLNTLGRQELPFVFGGDGALLAIPNAAVEKTRIALAAVQAWVADELDLSLRAAIVPMSVIRAEGLDVRVARFQASEQVTYAMFTGGGASWVEAQMKAGRFAITPAPPGTRPDLTGLSCRWNPIEASRGEIVSIIAVPGPRGGGAAFQQLVADVVALAANEGHSPVTVDTLTLGFPPHGLEYEAKAVAPKGKRLMPKLAAVTQMALSQFSLTTGISLGTFNGRRYKQDVVENSDFRKFDDGLKMTIDIGEDGLARIEQRLREAEAAGVCSYGLHRQDSALMTCFVVSPLSRNHIHFIDGASGGYAMAARGLKAKAAA